MRIATSVERTISGARVNAARIACLAAASLLAVTPLLAQNDSAPDARMGVSHPDPSVVVASPDSDVDAPPSAPAKPSAAIPASAQSGGATVYGPYVPYRAAGYSASTATAQPAAAFDPDANIVTAETAGRADRRLLSEAVDKNDVNSGIVTYVPSQPGEIPEGALFKVRLREELSTLTTKPGTKFTAEVSEPMMRDGKVIVPVGALLEGRVTYVRGGRRIGGAAAIRLEPRTITLPDGTQYFVRAQVIDTDRFQTTKVDSEGTIIRRDMSKGTVGAMSLSTGGAMAAGAMIAGVPGAVVGAGIGAGVSTVVWLKQDRQANLPKNLGVVFSLTEPMSVTPASARTVQPAGASGGE